PPLWTPLFPYTTLFRSSKKSITFALLANLGIAITKTAAAIVTGSGALLAESIHSYADCSNQGLLFWGLRATKKKPDPEHPLGYGDRKSTRLNSSHVKSS